MTESRNDGPEEVETGKVGPKVESENNDAELYMYFGEKSEKYTNKIDKIVLPSDKNITNDVLENHCKKFVKTNYHPSGTAKMGADNDNESVLDAKMRVKGIDNLRVSDLSAMP